VVNEFRQLQRSAPYWRVTTRIAANVDLCERDHHHLVPVQGPVQAVGIENVQELNATPWPFADHPYVAGSERGQHEPAVLGTAPHGIC
jgi:hypothetical protein